MAESVRPDADHREVAVQGGEEAHHVGRSSVMWDLQHQRRQLFGSVPEQFRLRCDLGVSGKQDRGRPYVHPQDERVVVGVRPCAPEAAFRTEDVDPDVAYQEERSRAGVPDRDGGRPHGAQK